MTCSGASSATAVEADAAGDAATAVEADAEGDAVTDTEGAVEGDAVASAETDAETDAEGAVEGAVETDAPEEPSSARAEPAKAKTSASTDAKRAADMLCFLFSMHSMINRCAFACLSVTQSPYNGRVNVTSWGTIKLHPSRAAGVPRV